MILLNFKIFEKPEISKSLNIIYKILILIIIKNLIFRLKKPSALIILLLKKCHQGESNPRLDGHNVLS